MKTAALAVAVLAAILVAITSEGQVGEAPTSTAGWETLMLPESPPSELAIRPLSKQGQANLSTNTVPGKDGKSPPAVFRGRPLSLSPGEQPLPGVYETAPYTCIVVVPGPHPDDKMIAGRQERMTGTNKLVPRMPVIRPELRFIPRGKH